MSLTRRLAAGLPVAGVTILAAVALGGAPASATPEDAAAHAAQPAVMTQWQGPDQVLVMHADGTPGPAALRVAVAAA